MAEFAAWGPEQAGERLADYDRYAFLQKGLTALKTAGEIADQPIDRRVKESHANLYEAQALEKRNAAARDQAFLTRMQQMASGEPQGEPADPIKRADSLAEIAYSVGDFKTGRELANAASLMRSRNVTGQMRNAQAANYRSQIEERHLKTLGNLFSTVTDQPSYERAMLQAAGMGLPIEQMPLSYEEGKPMVNQLTNAAIGAAKSRELGMRETKDEADAVLRRERIEAYRSRRSLDRARENLINERTSALQKNGGDKPISPAKPAEVKETKTLIREAGIPMENDKQLDIAANDIADEAYARTRKHAGLTRATATRQVLEERMKDGSFEPVGGFLGMGAKNRYKRPEEREGATTKNPISLPKKLTPDLIKQMKPGSFYKAPDGGVYKYLGNGKLELSSLSAMDHLAALGEDDDDDEDLA